MFDFRYHALSLAAVLIALAVGLLLGVAIGDAGLVSSAEHKLREGLRKDVVNANQRAADLRESLGQELKAAHDFEDAAYPLLVGDHLRGRRIGLVFLGSPSRAIADDVGDALQHTGGQIALRAVVREPLDLGALAVAAKGTRYATLDTSPNLLESFGFRIGAQFATGGQLIGRLRSRLVSSFNGRLQPLDGIVVVRRSPALSGAAATARDAFERGFVHGVSASKVPLAGVEATDTDPSQVSWYRKHAVPSVDDVDRRAGKVALVFVLQGGVDGAFGLKSSAEAVLPDLVPPSGP